MRKYYKKSGLYAFNLLENTFSEMIAKMTTKGEGKMTRLKFTLVLLVFAVISSTLGIAFTKASADERDGQRNGQRNDRPQQQRNYGPQQRRNDRPQQRGWGQREHINYQGKNYDYHEGRFYTSGLFGAILDLVMPPRGIVINNLPTGCRTIIMGGTAYYEYENIYYQPCPGGYTVVQPPAVVNPYVSSPVVYAPPSNMVVPSVQPQPSGGGTIIVNVPTATGGTVAITLIRYSNGFTGPQGEFYPNFPSTEELSARYAR